MSFRNPGPGRVGLLAVVALLLGSAAAHAATIHVEIRERDGPPVDGVRCFVRPSDAVRWYRRIASAVTGRDGTAELADVPPGTYTLQLSQPRDPDLLLPKDNPWVDAPVVTLPEDGSTAEVSIELWRGVPIALDVLSLHSDLPSGKIVLRHAETGAEIEQHFNARDGSAVHVDRAMVEARWTVRLDVPPGFVIGRLEVNGEAIPGGAAEVDTSADPRTQFIHWELYAPCEVWGRAAPSDGGDRQGVTVVAELIEPGPWIASETARGRRHDVVPAQHWETPNEYHIRLPEGVWRIRPDGNALSDSEPASVELRLTPGESKRQDFELRLRGGDDGLPVDVAVSRPDGDLLPDAFVALYRAGEAGRERPVRTARTGGRHGAWHRMGHALFYGVPEGSYDVVAGHPDWLDGRGAVAVDPEDAERRRTTVRVSEGATALAFAFDHDDRSPVPSVEVVLTWLDEEFPSVLDDPELDSARKLRRARTDATGFATIEGLAEGRYRIDARVTGERQRTRYVRVRLPGATERESIDLDTVPPQRYDVELPVYPGATIGGVLRCDDSGPLPDGVSVRVYEAEAPWGGIELGPGTEAAVLADAGEEAASTREPEPVLRLDAVLLEGPRLDRFTIGPLEAGAYVVALRPQGYDAWSWLYGTDLRREAALVQLPSARSIDVASVAALCAPALVVRPRIASDQALPDLRLGRYGVEATARRDTGDPIEVHPVVEARRGHLLVRGLVEGTTGVTLEIRHPYLMPPSLTFEVSGLDLKRGTRRTEHAPFAAVGGALAVRTALPAVRLVADGKPVATAPTTDGEARLEGVAPGRYVLETCRDLDCSRAAPVREVPVESYRTRHVELD